MRRAQQLPAGGGDALKRRASASFQEELEAMVSSRTKRIHQMVFTVPSTEPSSGQQTLIET